jgi:pilus assembly protein CpaB
VVAVPADAVSATGHLLQPGDRVDVIVYVSANSRSGIEQPMTQTVLQDVRVFAVNEHWRTEGDKGAETIAARTVSLLVTPPQVELVTLAAEMGRIRLSLRNPGDEVVAETSGKGASDLLGGGDSGDREKEWGSEKQPNSGSGEKDLLGFLNKNKQPQAAAPPAVAVAPPQPVSDEERFTMEVLKGEELSTVDFTRNGKEGRWRHEGAGGSSSSSTDPTAGVTPPSVVPEPGADPVPVD